MKYSRKDVTQLFEAVNGAPDVYGYASSTPPATCSVNTSGVCVYLSCGSVSCEDPCNGEDTSCTPPPPPPRC
ncbi:MAG TPA: hypothetical protein VH877_19420 [Polyangia bacterium]|nr:hypothetical protein [Polyangia bacterium]